MRAALADVNDDDVDVDFDLAFDFAFGFAFDFAVAFGLATRALSPGPERSPWSTRERERERDFVVVTALEAGGRGGAAEDEPEAERERALPFDSDCFRSSRTACGLPLRPGISSTRAITSSKTKTRPLQAFLMRESNYWELSESVVTSTRVGTYSLNRTSSLAFAPVI